MPLEKRNHGKASKDQDRDHAPRRAQKTKQINHLLPGWANQGHAAARERDPKHQPQQRLQPELKARHGLVTLLTTDRPPWGGPRETCLNLGRLRECPRMKKLAIGIIASQLAAAVVLILDAANRNGRSMPLLFCLCLLSAHACLLGMWGALSKWDAVWRLSILTTGGAIVGTEFHLAAKLPIDATLLIALAPVGCLFALHRIVLIRSRFVLFDRDSLKRSTRPQFTILQVLSFTTIVAVVAAFARFVSLPDRPLLQIRLADDYLLDVATFSLCAILVTAVCSWALFSVRWSGRYWLAILSTPVIAGLFPIFYRNGPDPWIFVLVSVVQAAILCSVLLPLRLLGYRFVRRESPRNESTAPADLAAHPLD